MSKKSTTNGEQLGSESDLRTIRIALRVLGNNESCESDFDEATAIVGEARIRVNLTNAVDEALVRRGLLTADKIRSYEADALVDTGVIRSVLPLHVVEQLGLATVGKARATYANDATEDVDVTEVVGINIKGRRTTEETLVLGSEVLIGQTVLESLDLQVDCAKKRVIPNPAHPDQPIIKIKLTSTLTSRYAGLLGQ